MERILHLIPASPPWPPCFQQELGRRLGARGLLYEPAPERFPHPREGNAPALVLLCQNAPLPIRFTWILRTHLGFGPPLAMIGDGADYSDYTTRQRVQRAFWIRQANWFFAPSIRSKQTARNSGFPPDRITRYCPAHNPAIPPLHSDAANKPNSLSPFVLYIGQLRSEIISFLTLALFALRALLPTVQAAILGDGRARETVASFCRDNPWCIWIPHPTADQITSLLLRHPLQLYPHPIGIELLNAFARGIPLLTIEHPRHGPEIELLRPGVNSLIAPPRPGVYARVAADALQNPEALRSLAEKALQESRRLTVESMAETFAQGIANCLERTKEKSS